MSDSEDMTGMHSEVSGLDSELDSGGLSPSIFLDEEAWEDEDDDDNDDDDDDDDDDEEGTDFTGETDPDNYTEYESDSNDEEGTEFHRKRRRGNDTAATFPQFSRLPMELRLRIWELHCPALCVSARVYNMVQVAWGRMAPGPQVMRQTRPLRRLMRTCHEARILGLRTLPDTLPLGVWPEHRRGDEDEGVLRFNGQTDIFYVMLEQNPDGFIGTPYPAVRNLALLDFELRSRRPGVYYDHEYGHSVISIVPSEDTSHQKPASLRSKKFDRSVSAVFPGLTNLYVVEPGVVRRMDAWVGADDHEKFALDTYERSGTGRRLAVRSVFCWHAPPKAGVPAFQEDVVINYLPVQEARGVRHSRMLLYELDEGMDTLMELRTLCPGGVWPTDPDGNPRDDDPPLFDEEETEEEYDSEGIDDEGEDDSELDDSDDLVVLDDGDSEDSEGDESEAVATATANFSSPEPEPEPKPESATPTSSRRSKRRVVDSDDEGEEEAPQTKRQRRLVKDDSEEEEEEEEGEEAVKEKEKEKGFDGNEDDSDDDDTAEPKPLSLAERLRLNREQNPIPSDDDDELSTGSRGRGEYGGPEGGSDDEDEWDGIEEEGDAEESDEDDDE